MAVTLRYAAYKSSFNRSLKKPRQIFALLFVAALLLAPVLNSVEGPLWVAMPDSNSALGGGQHIEAGQIPEGLNAVEWAAIQQAMAVAEYHFAWQEDGTSLGPSAGSYWAPNRAQGWDLLFDESGVRATPRGDESWTWGLSLTGYGYADAIQGVDGPSLAAEKATLNYQWDANLTEWWINDPAGLEQGFTLLERPPLTIENSSSPLVLEMALSGTLSPVQPIAGKGIHFQNVSGETILTYDKLHVTDARGNVIPAKLTIDPSQLIIRIVVDDTAAIYPLTIDPWTQTAKMTASDGAAGDDFGYSVAMSGDTLVVGALAADIGANGDQGAVYVFEKPGGGWASGTQTAKLTASDGAAGDQFGYSVSVSGDTLVVGAAIDDDIGSAYVFEKGAGWANGSGNQTAKLTASDGVQSDTFGVSVSVSGDTVVVGAHGDDTARGLAYVFEKPGGGWADGNETAKLKASDRAAEDRFGRSVSVSGDTVMVGAYSDDIGANNNQGSVYVFEEPGGADGRI